MKVRGNVWGMCVWGGVRMLGASGEWREKLEQQRGSTKAGDEGRGVGSGAERGRRGTQGRKGACAGTSR